MNIDIFPNKNQILNLIKENYGLNIQTISFVNKGYGDHNYFITDKSGKKYFLKIARNVKGTTIGLKVCQYLHEIAFTNISQVITTKSNTIGVLFEKHLITILEFIDGAEIGEIKNEETERLALMILSKLHRIKLTQVVNFIPRISFIAASGKSLFNKLQQVKIKHYQLDFEKQFQKMLADNYNLLIDAIDKLNDLTKQCVLEHQEFVICHRDCHGYNFMKMKTGELFLIDWDSVKLAPPEQDLIFFSEENISKYYPFPKNKKLNQKTFLYFALERQIDDLQAFVETILLSDTVIKEKQASFENVLEFGYEFDLCKIIELRSQKLSKYF
ncbi:MAG: aminoglycoside phosphotransferase family protein [bacterium]